ncbi:MAG TPA: hypothetical protein VMB34_00445 [Acetobacteraceae bacterium]|nr:hypothetical protein [Acetobacteraceae bacterium]
MAADHACEQSSDGGYQSSTLRQWPKLDAIAMARDTCILIFSIPMDVLHRP